MSNLSIPAPGPSRFEKALPWLLFAATAAFVVVHNRLVTSGWTVDDVFITYRYSINWAAGHGPVYNPNEDPVEGYTCFLWMAMLALTTRLGFDIVESSRALGMFFGLASFALMAWSYRFVPGLTRMHAAFATLLFATFGLFHPWITNGMETTQFAFSVILLLLLHLKSLDREATRFQHALTGVAGALCALSRPEGVMVFGLVVLDHCIECLRRRSLYVIDVVTPFLILYAPYLAWRITYYGYLLPNTFYVKVGSGKQQMLRGARYVYDFARFAWPVLIPCALALAPAVPWWRRFGRARVLLVLPLVYTFYIMLVGGDFFLSYRFFVPLAAPLCLLAATAFAATFRKPFLLGMGAALLIGANLHAMFTTPGVFTAIRGGDFVAKCGIEVGKWLREHARNRPNAVLATNTAGTLPFYSGLRTIDMLGLNDEHIGHRAIPSLGSGFPGHEKGDGKYVLDRKPDIVQFASARGAREPRFRGDSEMFRDPRFKREYVYRQYRMPSGLLLHLYERNDFRGATPAVNAPAAAAKPATLAAPRPAAIPGPENRKAGEVGALGKPQPAEAAKPAPIAPPALKRNGPLKFSLPKKNPPAAQAPQAGNIEDSK